VSCEQYYAEDELLEDGRCPIHRTPVDLLEEENYFFTLSAFEDRLIAWYESAPTAVIPESKRNEALSFIRGGLRDISITRTSIDWGVAVPWDERHVFYVWYDALINYLTAIGYGEDDERFAAWWPVVHHMIGKEIIRFHCVWWPAMCMAAGIDPPAHVQVHGWLLVGGEKMSKSSLNQITPGELTADYGVDPVRYHLLRDTPLGADGDFSAEGITARYNADLANNLGNLLSRVATVVGSKCGGVGPAPDPDSRLAAVSGSTVAEATEAWNSGLPHLGLEATWRLIRETNAELEQAEPWKSDPGPAVNAVLGSALEVLRIVSVLIVPAMPTTARAIWTRIGLPGAPDEQRLPAAAAWGGYPGGLAVEKGAPLFPRRKG
jgi:methionyl-tRNA synthetase